MSAPVCSRRVSAGITPAPGTTSRLPVWWGPTDWLEVEVRGALRENVDVCRAHHVSPDTVYAVARAMAGYADAQTGRNCRPTNERLVEDARCSLSTVQRARRVLKALELVVEVTAGRSVLTLAERLAAWERGSSHRAIAAEFALCSRRHRPLQAVDNPAAGGPAVDRRDTPPVGQLVTASAREIRGSLRTESRNEEAAARPLTPGRVDERRARPVDLRARRLAEAVRRRVAWLADVPTSRMVPTLTRFALAGWDAVDVDLATQDVLTRRCHRVPAVLRQPAAYLAGLLRDVDPADRPGALEEQRRAEERREREYRRLLVYGAPCPHGQPAGDVPSPLRGVRACPQCRAAAEGGSW